MSLCVIAWLSCRLGSRAEALARTVQTTMFGAGPARTGYLLLQRLAGPKNTHACVARRDALFRRIVLHLCAVDLDPLQRLRVFGLQCLRELTDALTDLVLHVHAR